MSTTQSTGRPSPLPEGVWEIDQTASQLSFKARGMFGLAPVKGSFADFRGTLTVTDTEAHGQIDIAANSLDTGNAKRDEHLRSADFFNVATDPRITFTVRAIRATAGDVLEAIGTLQIRDTSHTIKAPLNITRVDQDRLRVTASVSVDRSAAGVGWSKMGMVQGKAHLNAAIHLVRVETD